MDTEDFDKVVKSQIENVLDLLVVKGKEYSRGNNRLLNFELGSKKLGISREKVLLGYLTKHIVSIDTIVEDLETGVLPTEEILDEKFTDVINYYILLKASILNRIKNEKPN